MEESAEKRVVDAVLQRPREVKVGDKIYKVSPPNTTTILLVSERISMMPEFKVDTNNVTIEALRLGKYGFVLGEVTAMLMLGSKNFVSKVKRRFLGKRKVNNVLPLANALLDNIAPKELYELFLRLYGTQDIADFLAFITSLQRANLVNPTTTVSGQQSRA